MVTFFTKKDLVNFGEYLCSDERRARFQASYDSMLADGMNPIPVEERLKAVHDADLANWKHKQSKHPKTH